MWLRILAEATDPKGGFDWGPLATFGAAILALSGVAVTVVVSLRTSKATQESQRESDLDDRVDAELVRVIGERDKLRADNDKLREDYTTLWQLRNQVLEREVSYRRWIREQGKNPDEVLSG